MKQLLCSLAVWLSLWATLQATNTLTIGTAQGSPGDEVEVSVSLQNSDAVYALQFTIPLDDALHYVDGSIALNAIRSNSHSISALSQDGVLSVYVYSLGLNALKGNNGPICSFRLKLGKAPGSYPLTPSVKLSNASGSALLCSSVAGSVTISAPQLTLETTSIDWNRVAIRSSYSKSLILRNTGNTPLTITRFLFSAPEFSAAATPITIAAGENKSITVTYAPTKHGTMSETLTILSDASNGKQTVALTATPYSVNTLSIGSASGISDQEVTVNLTMANMEPIVAMQCSFTLPMALEYVDGSFTTASRSNGFTPAATLNGQKLSLYLYSSSNQPIERENGVIGSFRVKLNGKSGTYQLAPENVVLGNIALENMTSSTSYGTITIQSPSLSCASFLSMGSTPVTETASATFTLHNTGKVPMELSKVTFLAEGLSIAEALPITIANGSQKNITVQYSPTKAGDYSTTMNIYTNDPDKRMKSITVSGSIFEPNELTLEGKYGSSAKDYVISIGLDNYSDVAAIQMDIHVPSGMKTSSEKVSLSGTRLPNHSFTLVSMSKDVYRLVLFSMSNGTIKEHTGELATIAFVYDGEGELEGQQILVTDEIISNTKGQNAKSGQVEAWIISQYEVPILGDVNNDGKINIGDFTSTANHILGNTPAVFVEKAADLNADGKINIGDLTGIANMILSGGVAKAPALNNGEIEANAKLLMPKEQTTLIESLPTDFNIINGNKVIK